jgi:hypothetical protein
LSVVLKKLIIYLVCALSSFQGHSQNFGNAIFVGAGGGIGFNKGLIFLHGSIGVTYLRYSQFGFSVNGLAFMGGYNTKNIGTLRNGNTLNVSACFAIQSSMSYGIIKLGLCRSDGYYVSTVGTASISEETAEYTAYGVYLAGEVISNSDPRWSIEVFGSITKYPMGGFTIRRNIGKISE